MDIPNDKQDKSHKRRLEPDQEKENLWEKQNFF